MYKNDNINYTTTESEKQDRERSKREDSKEIPMIFDCCWGGILNAAHRNDETCDKYLYEMRCSDLQRKPGEVG